jgi:hypothetical protein
MPIKMFFIVKNHWIPSFTDNSRLFWRCVSTCQLYCIAEELDCYFNIFLGFKGNV